MNDKQKRVLVSALSEVEKMMGDLERLLSVPSIKEGVFSAFSEPVSGKKSKELTLKIPEFKSNLKKIRDRFALDKETESIRNKCSSLIAGIWILLEEVKSKNLKGYGAVSKEDAKNIDELLNGLINQINKFKITP